MPGPSQVCTVTLPFTLSIAKLSAGGKRASCSWQYETRPLTAKPFGAQLSLDGGACPQAWGSATVIERTDNARVLCIIFVSSLEVKADSGHEERVVVAAFASQAGPRDEIAALGPQTQQPGQTEIDAAAEANRHGRSEEHTSELQ